MKKPPQKVAYLSRNSVVFRNFSLTAQQPKWQNSCSKMWSIEQLYIELGLIHINNLFIGSESFTQKLKRNAIKKSFDIQAIIVWLLVGVPGIVVTFCYVFIKTTSAKIDVKSEINVTQLNCHEVKKDWQEYIALSQYAIQGKDF